MRARVLLCLALLSATGAMAASSGFLLGVDCGECFVPYAAGIATDNSGALYILSDTSPSSGPNLVTKLSADGTTILWQYPLRFVVSGMAVAPNGYQRPVRALLLLYGIDLDGISSVGDASQPAHSHIVTLENEAAAYRIPVKMDPGFDLKETTNLGRMVQQWGTVPISLLNHLSSQKYTYAFIGMEDYTMHPILQPGSFVQVDHSEAKRRVVERQWRSEYERPIYLVETRNGLRCCWCAMRPNALVLQPHPLSREQVRILKHPQDAEVIGQVVGVAMRIGNQFAVEMRESGEFSKPKSDATLSSSGSLKEVTDTDLPSISTRKKMG